MTSTGRKPATDPVRAQPRESFEQLYERRYTHMVRLTRLSLGETAPCEEIVQDAFVQLYRNWDHIETPTAYLRIAVGNKGRS